MITSLDISFKAPLCGTVVKGDYWDNQTPHPSVTLPASAKYKLDYYDNYNYVAWFDLEGNYLEGVMKAGQTYELGLWLRTKEDYVEFADDPVITVPAGCKVVDYYNDGYYSSEKAAYFCPQP